MDFKLMNRIAAAIVFFISFFVLWSTVQPSVSFWDCGEFIAASYSLQVPHPPGAPFFLLVGRVFSMIPFVDNLGLRVNMVSVLSSALSIFFLYLIIVKIIENYRGKVANNTFEAVTTIVAAACGALSFSFSDTFWFNAVEAEVYAASTVLYAAIMYLIMLWNEKADEPGSERYLVFLAYLIGLSIGVHLMSVLAMVPVVMIITFRKYLNNQEEYDASVRVFLLHSLIILGFAAFMWGRATQAVPPTADEYSSFDKNFKIWLFIISLIVVIVFYKKVFTRNSIYFPFFIGGAALFLTYPGVVKYLPKLMSLIGGRTLSGELTFITVFLGVLSLIAYLAHKYKRATLHLVALSAIFILLGFATYTQVIIRSNANPPMNENEPDDFPELVKYLNREQYGDFPTFKRRFTQEEHQQGVYLNYSSDLHFLYSYQMNHMMTRYLLWNYAGRESWNQDAGSNIAPFNQIGNTLGKPFNLEFSGDTKDSLFGIPFLLGIIGVIFHFRKDRKMAMAWLVLFIFMGYLTAYYQNQQQPQPRERDYFYVGAFFVFSLWIGIAIKEVAMWLYEKLKKESAGVALGYAVLLLGIFFVPVRMYSANVYTHDRSANWIPWDYAYNLLQSCAPNAILFTNGDNDTFPLWYLQDVEGVRRDIRVVNLSLANTEWYIRQMKNLAPYGTPKIKLSMSDIEIKNLRPELFDSQTITLNVSKEEFERLTKEYPDSVTYKPQIVWETDLPKIQDGRTYARVQDRVVIDLIKNAGWGRPVYYSTTCSEDTKIGLGRFLVLEGMAYRLMPFEVRDDNSAVNEKILSEQLMTDVKPDFYSKEYKRGLKFRSIADPNVFLDENQKRMTLNYRNSFYRLIVYYQTVKKDTAKAIQVLNKLEELLPMKRTIDDFRYRADYANMFRKVGNESKYEEIMKDVEPVAWKLINDNPQSVLTDQSTPSILLDYYEATKQVAKGLKLIDIFDQYYPNQPFTKTLRDKFNAIMHGKDPSAPDTSGDTTKQQQGEQLKQ
ncbi:MAG: DUF2723 domain-containing protein [Ignavibacteriales bacterium]|nr:MAG: DUF2723 domain-containing protein [Ignavibacteriaceae bacterium]MBW7873296.1 DUF2723 domain-containing protein [Ignavibacteria bacterium]MCZ2143032.1 DUF2723 domain-containing protein [Ignavibacteriales bacterium]OQY77642.1 MAG: membrane protein [Ignavibacteriales bacterium UTCHB3]MBV6444723.1 hypothetical protein [Ignavibacteriaceae bacterium]